ncbi:MAG: hypothetical protein EAZ87_07055 [Nostocales cyanobacterium]|nr:MAG: hypothetical protein EAZ87_07055 [Nostocales cyanobacterium]
MPLPMYLLLSYSGVSNEIHLFVNNAADSILSANLAENNDNFVTKSQNIAARDDQNDENKSCLNRGDCTV